MFRAEIKESFLMAMHALAAHKLRSALTLLGVLVGVFSIIVVMTAMRVLQQNIESELSRECLVPAGKVHPQGRA
jgi:putative ABC transport system permease protein